jgi:hypothetical protein
LDVITIEAKGDVTSSPRLHRIDLGILLADDFHVSLNFKDENTRSVLSCAAISQFLEFGTPQQQNVREQVTRLVLIA